MKFQFLQLVALSTSSALAVLLANPASAQETQPKYAGWEDACEDWDEWDKPGPPFPIFGDDTWYVGTCGIASILVVTSEGLVLIDSGTEAGAQIVLRNIETAGFDPSDIAYILTSHEHFDHVGGVAHVQRTTGARLVTSEAAAEAFRTGEVSLEDPQYGLIEGVSPARVDRIVSGGEVLSVGVHRFTAIATPGHTLGALSWSWQSHKGRDVIATVVYADSLSAVSADSYRFSDHPKLVADFRSGLAELASIGRCILITPHPSASGMREKIADGGTLLSGRTDCADYAADRLARLDARLAEEGAQ